jgi:hypothetical protein
VLKGEQTTKIAHLYLSAPERFSSCQDHLLLIGIYVSDKQPVLGANPKPPTLPYGKAMYPAVRSDNPLLFIDDDP